MKFAATREINVGDARKRFRDSPLGIWESHLGGGNDMNLGIRLTFNDDGTGTISEWGYEGSEPHFLWRAMHHRQIEITHEGKTRSVRYDFKTTQDAYGNRELRMFEPDLPPDEHREIGFWISPFSLVYRGTVSENQNTEGVFQRVMKRLKSK
jgi:hypothetical protein